MARRPPKSTAEIGTPAGSSHSSAITGHCDAGAQKRELGWAAGVSASIGPALGLAGVHGASRHPALHHFVATHAEPLALLTVGRFPRRDGSLPVWRSVESRAFARRHGQACGHYPEGLRPGTALHALAETARRSSDYPGDRVRLGESGRRLRAEAMYNRHAFLIMLAGA